MKKFYIITAILIILLYAAITLDQTKVIGLGELFGYLFYVIVAVGIIAAILLLIKPTQKKE
jgi:dipeptide/tripeptide permease